MYFWLVSTSKNKITLQLYSNTAGQCVLTTVKFTKIVKNWILNKSDNDQNQTKYIYIYFVIFGPLVNPQLQFEMETIYTIYRFSGGYSYHSNIFHHLSHISICKREYNYWPKQDRKNGVHLSCKTNSQCCACYWIIIFI